MRHSNNLSSERKALAIDTLKCTDRYRRDTNSPMVWFHANFGDDKQLKKITDALTSLGFTVSTERDEREDHDFFVYHEGVKDPRVTISANRYESVVKKLTELSIALPQREGKITGDSNSQAL